MNFVCIFHMRRFMTKDLNKLSELKQRIETIEFERQKFNEQYIDATLKQFDSPILRDNAYFKVSEARIRLGKNYCQSSTLQNINFNDAIEMPLSNFNKLKEAVLRSEARFFEDMKTLEDNTTPQNQSVLMFSQPLDMPDNSNVKTFFGNTKAEKQHLIAEQQTKFKSSLFEYRVFIDRHKAYLSDFQTTIDAIFQLESSNELLNGNKEIQEKVILNIVNALKSRHQENEMLIKNKKEGLLGSMPIEERQAFHDKTKRVLDSMQPVSMSPVSSINLLVLALKEQENKLEKLSELKSTLESNESAWQFSKTIVLNQGTLMPVLTDEANEPSDIKNILSLVPLEDIDSILDAVERNCSRLNTNAVDGVLDFIESSRVPTANGKPIYQRHETLYSKLQFMQIVQKENARKSDTHQLIDTALVSQKPLVKAALLFRELNLYGNINSTIFKENSSSPKIKVINFLDEHITDRKKVISLFKNPLQFELVNSLMSHIKNNSNLNEAIQNKLLSEIYSVKNESDKEIIETKMNALLVVKFSDVHKEGLNEQVISHHVDLAGSLINIYQSETQKAVSPSESLLNPKVLTALSETSSVFENEGGMSYKICRSEAYQSLVSLLSLDEDYFFEDRPLLESSFIRQLNDLALDEMDKTDQALSQLSDVYKTATGYDTGDKFKKQIVTVKRDICTILLDGKDKKHERINQCIEVTLDAKKINSFKRAVQNILRKSGYSSLNFK